MVDIDKVVAEAKKIYRDEDWFHNEVAMIWSSRLGPLIAALEQETERADAAATELGIAASREMTLQAALEQSEKRASTITHCEDCGGDWVDNGLQAGCHCKRVAELERAEKAARKRTVTNESS